MNEKKPWYKKWWVWTIGIIVFAFLIFGIPLIINNCYIKNKGYITVWGGTDILQFLNLMAFQDYYQIQA